MEKTTFIPNFMKTIGYSKKKPSLNKTKTRKFFLWNIPVIENF